MLSKRFYIYHLPIILYLILIFILSSIPGDSLPELGFELNDKFIHAGVYFFAYILFYLSFSNIRKESVISGNPLVFSLIFTNFYAILDEFHQAFVPNRSADFFDFIADFAGSLLGLIFILVYQNYIKPMFIKQKLTSSN
jgi:VanZ family protein